MSHWDKPVEFGPGLDREAFLLWAEAKGRAYADELTTIMHREGILPPDVKIVWESREGWDVQNS